MTMQAAHHTVRDVLAVLAGIVLATTNVPVLVPKNTISVLDVRLDRSIESFKLLFVSPVTMMIAVASLTHSNLGMSAF